MTLARLVVESKRAIQTGVGLTFMPKIGITKPMQTRTRSGRVTFPAEKYRDWGMRDGDEIDVMQSLLQRELQMAEEECKWLAVAAYPHIGNAVRWTWDTGHPNTHNRLCPVVTDLMSHPAVIFCVSAF